MVLGRYLVFEYLDPYGQRGLSFPAVPPRRGRGGSKQLVHNSK